jgi:hypothetical protein
VELLDQGAQLKAVLFERRLVTLKLRRVVFDRHIEHLAHVKFAANCERRKTN